MSTIFSENIFARFQDQFQPFLAKLDITEAIFTRPDIEITVVKYAKLLESVGREVNPHIGLDLGESLDARDLGVIGHAAMASSIIGDALALISRYLYVLSQSNTIRLDIGDNEVVCTYTATILQPDLVRQDAEFALAMITTLIRKLSGRCFSPRLVEFSHREFSDTGAHNRAFDCEVRFDGRENRLHFSRRVLDYPIPSSDRQLLEALIYYLDSRLRLRSEEDDLQDKVRHLISVSLGKGIPDIKQIASQLGMSSRTLQRKLAEKGLVFSEMLESICKSIASEYVLHSNYSFTDIALILGYNDLSSFSRAFKRWTGLGPLQAREAGSTDSAAQGNWKRSPDALRIEDWLQDRRFG